MILQMEEGTGEGKGGFFFKTQFSVISESRPCPPAGNGGPDWGSSPPFSSSPGWAALAWMPWRKEG